MFDVIIDMLFPFVKKIQLLLLQTCCNSRKKKKKVNLEMTESFHNHIKAKKFNMSFLSYS